MSVDIGETFGAFLADLQATYGAIEGDPASAALVVYAQKVQARLEGGCADVGAELTHVFQGLAAAVQGQPGAEVLSSGLLLGHGLCVGFLRGAVAGVCAAGEAVTDDAWGIRPAITQKLVDVAFDALLSRP